MLGSGNALLSDSTKPLPQSVLTNHQQSLVTPFCIYSTYRKTSNISRTLLGNKIVDHSDEVGALPAGAALTTSSFST